MCDRSSRPASALANSAAARWTASHPLCREASPRSGWHESAAEDEKESGAAGLVGQLCSISSRGLGAKRRKHFHHRDARSQPSPERVTAALTPSCGCYDLSYIGPAAGDFPTSSTYVTPPQLRSLTCRHGRPLL